MKCKVTGEETVSLCKGIPLSHEGRRKVKEYKAKVEDFAKKIDQPLIMTTKIAIDNLANGFDLVEELSKKYATEDREEDE